MLMQRAITEATPSMRELAEETGFNYSTLRAWKIGRRIPEAKQLSILGRALRRRAARLQELADELERAAGEE